MTSNINDGGFAFPLHVADGSDGFWSNGMSLRDWFAGQALAGLLARGVDAGIPWGVLAEGAYRIADAMLAERAKERKP